MVNVTLSLSSLVNIFDTALKGKRQSDIIFNFKDTGNVDIYIMNEILSKYVLSYNGDKVTGTYGITIDKCYKLLPNNGAVRVWNRDRGLVFETKNCAYRPEQNYVNAPDTDKYMIGLEEWSDLTIGVLSDLEQISSMVRNIAKLEKTMNQPIVIFDGVAYTQQMATIITKPSINKRIVMSKETVKQLNMVCESGGTFRYNDRLGVLVVENSECVRFANIERYTKSNELHAFKDIEVFSSIKLPSRESIDNLLSIGVSGLLNIFISETQLAVTHNSTKVEYTAGSLDNVKYSFTLNAEQFSMLSRMCGEYSVDIGFGNNVIMFKNKYTTVYFASKVVKY